MFTVYVNKRPKNTDKKPKIPVKRAVWLLG